MLIDITPSEALSIALCLKNGIPLSKTERKDDSDIVTSDIASVAAKLKEAAQAGLDILDKVGK